MDAFKRIYPEEYYLKFLEQDVRPDGRNLTDVRNTLISVGTISTANGSSFVKIGTTSVVCGIKAEVGQKQSNLKSNMVINVELLPLCSPKFPRGKPSDKAQLFGHSLNELAETILPSEQFLIPNTELMWYLYIDIYCLDYNGNVFDACLIALIAALGNVQRSKIKINDKEEIVALNELEKPFELSKIPLSLTFSFVENYILSDPTAEEENLQKGAITIILDQQNVLVSVFKQGGASLADDKLKTCVGLTEKRLNELRKELNKVWKESTTKKN